MSSSLMALGLLGGCTAERISKIDNGEMECTINQVCGDGSIYSMELDVDLAHNFTLNYSEVSSGFVLRVKGTCDPGGFPDNRIGWDFSLKASQVADRTEKDQAKEVCQNGSYDFNIVFQPGELLPGTEYVFFIYLYGIDRKNNEFLNLDGAAEEEVTITISE